ncbi:MAG: hypothetical protein RL417_604 [Pseudomonadota bacterium]
MSVRFFLVFAISLITVSLLGCVEGPVARSLDIGTASSLVTRSGSPNDFISLASVAVLPVRYDQKVRLLGDEVRARADRELATALERELDFKLISPEAVLRAIPEAVVLEPTAVGRRLGADGILVTTVHQFVERNGSALGADQPAVVDFTMRIVRADNGGEVWRAAYHFDDEPLSENVLNLGARITSGGVGRFRSAQEILANGFTLAGREFASVRQATFQR